MRLPMTCIFLLSACAPPSLEVRVTRASEAELQVSVAAFDGAGAAGRGEVTLDAVGAVVDQGTRALDVTGFAAFVVGCEGGAARCDGVTQLTARWAGLSASTEGRFRPPAKTAEPDGPAADGPLPTAPHVTTTIGSGPAAPPSSPPQPSCPRLHQSFGGGATEVFLTVRHSTGDVAASTPGDHVESTVWLQVGARRVCVRTLDTGVVSIRAVPAGVGLVDVGTSRATPCVLGSTCASGYNSASVTIAVPASGVARLSVPSGW